MQRPLRVRDVMYAFLFARIKAGDRVLDAGCGDGALALAITRRIPKATVVGIEPDRALARHANQRFRRAGCAGRVRCRRGDAEDARLLFGRRRFECAIVHNAFHEFWRPVAALRSIRAALKPGGLLLIAELAPRFGETVDDCPRYSREKLREFATRAGFRRCTAALRHPNAILLRAEA